MQKSKGNREKRGKERKRTGIFSLNGVCPRYAPWIEGMSKIRTSPLWERFESAGTGYIEKQALTCRQLLFDSARLIEKMSICLDEIGVSDG